MTRKHQASRRPAWASALGRRLLPLLLAAAGCHGSEAPIEDGQRSCASGSEKDIVLTRLQFARQSKPGVSEGFQLIDHVATAGDSATCGHASLRDPAGRPGINNQLSVLMQTVDTATNGAVDPLIQDAINSGMLLYGVRLLDLPAAASPTMAAANSDCVRLEFSLLGGKPSVGTDQRLDPNQTFTRQPGLMLSQATGVLHDGVIEAGPFELLMPIRILDAQFVQAVHAAHVRITLHGDGSASGVIGGGIDKKELLDHLKDLAIGKVRDVLPVLLDTIADLDPDSMTSDCHQFSGAFVFDAKSAFINN
jgi:hypothetical protein